MKRSSARLQLLVALASFLVAGCASGGAPAPTQPSLRSSDLNLVFVVSPDLDYQTPGDVDAATANLTSQGLQRALLMATYLKQHVLGENDVSGIHVLEPMTHLQTENGYPDMAAIGFMQQFALMNEDTRPVSPTATYTAHSFPLSASYAPDSVPVGVAAPTSDNAECRGLAFDDTAGDNAALVNGLIQVHAPGFHVFSAPWETMRALLADVERVHAFGLALPTVYQGTNVVYAIAVAPAGGARLVTFDAKLSPPATYPVLPAPVGSAACTQQSFFSTVRIDGVGGAHVPAGANVNERVYIVRHADAHPDPASRFENGNYVGAGQWRALDLPRALRGKISPDEVYSIDPSQSFAVPGTHVSYVRPSLTVLPYVIANNLPYHLVSEFSLTDADVATLASDYFFTGGRFSNHTVLLAWESSRIKPLLGALLDSYAAGAPVPTPTWPSTDYDTIWTVTLDAQGNVTVSNDLCEGIDSTTLPAAAPSF